ncbi:MAG: arylamine N-acetyltransferase [Planctomycetota bacterium]|nr:arylamine N-acetyltransferase [Planctomycetota bacterium]
MEHPTVDLTGYFARIGFMPPAGCDPSHLPCSLQVLSAIQFSHACSVPFENLDVLLHPSRGIALDLAKIQAKIITHRRGGYCFEQNGLLIAALTQIGFDVTPISARVRLAVAREVTPPRTHLFGRVMLDGVPYLVDVGVGSASPTTPLRMDTDQAQETPHDTRRIIQGEHKHARSWFHQMLIDGEWCDVHEFTGEQMFPIDREVANWWTSTNPHAKFRHNIMAALARPDGTRVTLNTREFFHRSYREGRSQVLEQRTIDSRAELHRVLHEQFGLAMPHDAVYGVDGL